MTQLDRLEALAEKWKIPGSFENSSGRISAAGILIDAFPDLIRVARAAHQVNRWVNDRSLAEALAPLFSEVES